VSASDFVEHGPRLRPLRRRRRSSGDVTHEVRRAV
jgi:hypothetical protein